VDNRCNEGTFKADHHNTLTFAYNLEECTRMAQQQPWNYGPAEFYAYSSNGVSGCYVKNGKVFFVDDSAAGSTDASMEIFHDGERTRIFECKPTTTHSVCEPCDMHFYS
jgi:hypothetical protein